MLKITQVLLGLLLMTSSLLIGQTTVTKSYTGPTVTVDGCGNYCVPVGGVTFDATDFPTGCEISDVNITINWLKTDGSCATPATGNSFHNETNFRLNGPLAQVILATPNTWSGGDDVPAVTTTFDQSAAGIPVNAAPVDGTFLPNGGDLNTFNGTSAYGNWVLAAGDTAGSDPLCVISYSVTVTVVDDTTPPVITCPANVVVNNDPGVCGANVTFAATATDPCGATITYSQDPGTLFPLGTTAVTATATDVNGNTSNCTFDVTVNDNEAPVLTCPATINANTDAGVCGATITYATPTATDNCGTMNFSETFTYTGAPENFIVPMGVTEITIQSWGAEGQAMTVDDYQTSIGGLGGYSEGTLAVTPGELLQINVGGTGADGIGGFNGGALGGIASSGNGGSAGFGGSGGGASDVRQGGTTLANRVIVAGGGGGGGRSYVNGTCVPCGIGGDGGAGGGIIGIDGEDPSDPIYGIYFNPGAGGSGGTATMGGAGGNGTQGMDGNPGVLGQGGVGINATQGAASGGGGGGYYGGGSGAGPNSGSGAAGGGAAGGSSYVGGVTSGITTAGVRTGDGEIVITYSQIVVSAATQTAGLPSGSVFPVGTTTNTFEVMDASGNMASCSFDVVVSDMEAPTAVCTPFTAQLDATGNVSITPADVDGGSADACGIASLAVSPSTFTCAEVGANTVTLTVTDVNGNSSTCTTTVTVEDNVAPTAVCQNIDVILDATGNASIVAADVEGGSTDNCAVATTTIDIMDFTCAEVGPNNVTLTVTDVNGNSSTCVAVVTVIDDVDPIISCPTDITTGTDPGVCGRMVTFTDAIASDACGIASVTQTDGLPSGSVFPVGVSTVEFTATDNNGNETVCSFTITVNDTEPAMAVCQDITIQLDATGNVSIVAADIDGGSTDNCGVASIDASQTDFTCADVGPNDVTLTVTDDNGNVSTCIAVVTVEDLVIPAVVCQNITVELDPVTGTVTIAGVDVDGGSTDACGIDTYTLDIDTFDCSNIGDNTVVLTVTDVNGNSDTCTAIVTVEDNTTPDLVCMDITVELDENGEAVITPADVIASNDDVCGILTTAVDITEFDCSDIGTPVTVQVFSQDASGNLASCMAVVTVVDALAPEVVCPADQTVDPGPGNLFYEIPDYYATGDATATDNCTDPLTIFSQDPAPGTLVPDGTYTITMSATDEYGNEGTCTFELDVVSILGVGDVSDLSTLVMYPNPANEFVRISNPQSLELEEAIIVDLRGRTVGQYDLRSMGSEIRIDISELATASYHVIIKGANGQINKRLLKE